MWYYAFMAVAIALWLSTALTNTKHWWYILGLAGWVVWGTGVLLALTGVL